MYIYILYIYTLALTPSNNGAGVRGSNVLLGGYHREAEAIQHVRSSIPSRMRSQVWSQFPLQLRSQFQSDKHGQVTFANRFGGPQGNPGGPKGSPGTSEKQT